jgi:hypothetical protein
VGTGGAIVLASLGNAETFFLFCGGSRVALSAPMATTAPRAEASRALEAFMVVLLWSKLLCRGGTVHAGARAWQLQ